MAEDAANFLLQLLKTIMVAHVDLISGEKEELNQLQSDVRQMKAALRESDSRPRRERQREYERRVRDVLHEAEDIVDECFTRAALNESRRFNNRFFSLTHFRLANQVKSFRNNTIKRLFNDFHILPITTDQPNGEITITHPSIYNGASSQGEASTSQSLVNGNLTDEEIVSTRTQTHMTRGIVVGLEEEADAIFSLLTQESRELKVISITGMPGIGKSTLARKVYESTRVRVLFPNVMWVDVTQEFDKRKAFLSILKSSAEVDNLGSRSDDELVPLIHSYLYYQKFLLILDDVWNTEDWDAIKTALPKDNSRGRVLITSRIESVVAREIWSGENSYPLGLLNENKSWDLLKQQVFGESNTCPEELNDLGETIAKRCGGLPLAIVVIGRVLFKKWSTSPGVNEPRIEWQKVANSVPDYFIDGNELTDNVNHVIALSYNELPLDLRYCFLYLGVFPEESRISIRRLYRLWIAEGFIWRKANMMLEDVAEYNLKELIDRNLVMVDNVKADGFIRTCRLHPLIREFCKNQASLENHNLFQEVKMSASDGTFNPPISEIRNRRRICIHSHIKDFLKKKPKGPRVHSLLCSAKEAVTSLPANSTSPIPRHFKRLRVVDVTPIKLPKYPSKLDRLIHLRYIALSALSDGKGAALWNLPKKVSRLWNLQSITIETNSRTFEIEANLWKMMHLRHLKTKAAIILPNKLEGPAGEQLQSVSRLSTQCCTEDVFNKAKNIQKLGICGDLNTILKVSCLRELHLLRKLKLVHDVYPEEASEKPLSRLPNHDVFPLNLRILQLSGTFLTWNQIRTLENLGGLDVLRLKNNAFVGTHWLAEEGCFRSLEILLIADTDLKVWTAKDSSFPKLKCLILKDCKQLDEIPFERTKSLHILHVENVSDSAVDSARRIAEIRRELKLIIPGIRGPASNI